LANNTIKNITQIESNLEIIKNENIIQIASNVEIIKNENLQTYEELYGQLINATENALKILKDQQNKKTLNG
ncbi:14986_t:CDS:1, partial [Dentiscutata erythropus]